MSQSDTFLSDEGDAWFHRNKDTLGRQDPVCDLLELLPLIRPKRVLEVGCANGWRLKKMQAKYGCRVSGIDTSSDAINAAEAGGLEDVCYGKFGPGQHAWLGGTFDMIIFGFCLYVTDPREWFKIVTEADRLLADDGYLIIHDFTPLPTPHAVKYAHKEGTLSYHVDFTKMWLAHPWYYDYDNCEVGEEKVTILKKMVNTIPVLI